MPLKTYNSKADFDADYDIGVEDGHPNTRPEVRLNYHYAAMMPYCRNRAIGIQSVMNWPLTRRLVIVGSGFGWLGEAFEELGFTNVFCVDISTYIQANKNSDESTDIDAAIGAVGLNPNSGEGANIKGRLHRSGGRSKASRGIGNQDYSTSQGRNSIRNVLGTVETVLSESVLESLTDQECVQGSSFLHSNQLNSPEVVHFVVTTRPNQVVGFNWKTLQEWKALLPNDIFIEAGTFIKL